MFIQNAAPVLKNLPSRSAVSAVTGFSSRAMRSNLFTRLPWRYVRTDFQFLEVFAILLEGSSSARDWLKAILPITPAIGESGQRVRNTKLGSILWDTPGGATPRTSRRRIQKASILKASRVVFNIKGNDYRWV